MSETIFGSTDTEIFFVLIYIERLLVGASGDVCLLLLAVAEKKKKPHFVFCNPNGNKAVVIFTLLPVQHSFNGSWSHHLGKQQRGKAKQVTPLAMPSP